MTERKTDFLCYGALARLPIVIAMLGIAACTETIGGPATPDEDDPNPVVTPDAGPVGNLPGNSPPANDGGVANVPPVQDGGSPVNPGGGAAGPCALAPKKAEAALTTYCGSCHGAAVAGAGMGGFKGVDDPLLILSSGKVIPGKPDESNVLKRMLAGNMPPVSIAKRPGDADIQAVKDWIACGAENWDAAPGTTPPRSFSFLTVDDRLSTMLRDVRKIANPTDRLRVRYLDLSMLANAGYSEAQMQVYREAVSFLLNSLSTGGTVISPRAIDADKLIYRIDLRDYGWDQDTWTLFESIYPYAVIYDQDSRLFPFDEATAEQLRDETGTQIPYIQGDWFISHGARPPLYFDVLEIPATLGELEAQLGVNIDQNIADEQVLRAGFKNAGPSQNNRVIERHDLGGNRGALWVSYDFANNLNDSDVFANPLDFQEDGGEAIFNLDNGLQAYYIINAAGVRQDKAPTAVVQDPLSRDGAVETGLSCMNCHQEDGQLPKFDEIREFTLQTGENAQVIDAVLGIYATEQELQDAFDRDQNIYRTARAALGITKVTPTTMHSLDGTHLGLIDINAAAAAVGITAQELERAIDASAQAFPAAVISLRNQGGAVQRDAFEAALPELIDALGLGQQLVVTSSGARRVSSTSTVIRR